MKNLKLFKINILALTLVMSMIFTTNAEIIYSPGAYTGEVSSPANDPALNPPASNNTVSDEDAAKISQIIVARSADSNGVTVGAPIVESPATLTTNTTSQTTTTTTTTQVSEVDPLRKNNFTVKNISVEKAPTISAPAAVLINATTKHIYASKDMNGQYEPAGLANLMTAYLATQKFKMQAVLTVNRSAVQGVDKDAAIAALNEGDTITLKDAIASMFVKGCVDSANVIAENVSGNIDEFVKLMNSTAQSLGLTNTVFVNPSGINNDNQHVSAIDMAIVMAKVCENPELVELMSLSEYTLPAVKAREKLTIYSKNTQLLSSNSTYNADVAASRMGYNSKAMYCIASMMKYNGNQVIVVVLKSKGTQFSDTKKLLEYGKIACASDSTDTSVASSTSTITTPEGALTTTTTQTTTTSNNATSTTPPTPVTTNTTTSNGITATNTPAAAVAAQKALTTK